MYPIDVKKRKFFTKKLLDWHRHNSREFPWRETNDPYHILVAEIMLQKTDADKVERIFETFISKYPTPDVLAKADVDQVGDDIKLLGLHYRASRLSKIASDIVEKHGGCVPQEKEELIAFIGVGEYIANAVLCFGFGRDVPLLDTNVVRVMDRVFSVKTSKSRARTDRILWETVGTLIPVGLGRDINLGILDFSATMCRSRNPLHDACPMKGICDFNNRCKQGPSPS